jgi:hypothetical protein
MVFPAQVNQFRQLYSKVINDKHDDVMAKFGAILAQGILDAGQCVVTCGVTGWISLEDKYSSFSVCC